MSRIILLTLALKTAFIYTCPLTEITPNFAQRLYLCESCDCHNKQQSFAYTAVVELGVGSFVVRWGTNF
jgi:hypothetical protein